MWKQKKLIEDIQSNNSSTNSSPNSSIHHQHLQQQQQQQQQHSTAIPTQHTDTMIASISGGEIPVVGSSSTQFLSSPKGVSSSSYQEMASSTTTTMTTTTTTSNRFMESTRVDPNEIISEIEMELVNQLKKTTCWIFAKNF